MVDITEIEIGKLREKPQFELTKEDKEQIKEYIRCCQSQIQNLRKQAGMCGDINKHNQIMQSYTFDNGCILTVFDKENKTFVGLRLASEEVDDLIAKLNYVKLVWKLQSSIDSVRYKVNQ